MVKHRCLQRQIIGICFSLYLGGVCPGEVNLWVELHASLFNEVLACMLLRVRQDEAADLWRGARSWRDIGFKHMSSLGYENGGPGKRADYGNKEYAVLLRLFLMVGGDMRVIFQLAVRWSSLWPDLNQDVELMSDHQLEMQGDLIEIYFGVLRANFAGFESMLTWVDGEARLAGAPHIPLPALLQQFSSLCQVQHTLTGLLVTGTVKYKHYARIPTLVDAGLLAQGSVVHLGWAQAPAKFMASLASLMHEI